MTTLKSSDLGGKLEKREEEEENNYNLIGISLHVGLLMETESLLTGED